MVSPVEARIGEATDIVEAGPGELRPSAECRPDEPCPFTEFRILELHVRSEPGAREVGRPAEAAVVEPGVVIELRVLELGEPSEPRAVEVDRAVERRPDEDHMPGERRGSERGVADEPAVSEVRVEAELGLAEICPGQRGTAELGVRTGESNLVKMGLFIELCAVEVAVLGEMRAAEHSSPSEPCLVELGPASNRTSSNQAWPANVAAVNTAPERNSARARTSSSHRNRRR